MVNLGGILGFPLLLTVDSVSPQQPVEHQPMQVRFTLVNHSGSAVSGTVSPTNAGGATKSSVATVSNLANGSKFQGLLSFNAPNADEQKVEIGFWRQPPRHPGMEFPPPDVVGDAALDIASVYNIRVDRFRIQNTRSKLKDTDFVGLQLQVNNSPVTDERGNAINWKRMGDVGGGVHEVGLSGFHPITVAFSSKVGINYQILNHGYNLGGLNDFFNAVSSATAQVLGDVFKGTNWSKGDELTRLLNSYQFADCDGVCAIDFILKTGGEMYAGTKRNGILTETRKYPGDNISPQESDLYRSPVGCGASPIYFVDYTIQRLSFPP
jgi:hypothetical protein